MLQQLRSDGLQVGAYKPACSGAEFDDAGRPHWRDIDALVAAAGFTGDSNLICPQRFIAPLAPNVAAKLEGRSVDDALLADAFHHWEGQADVVVVEGAGGLLSPLSDDSTNADLAVRLQLPLIIVAANRLGVLNHTALTVEAATRRGLSILAVVLNTVSASHGRSEANSPADSNAAELTRMLTGTPVFGCGFGDSVFTALNDDAKSAVSLSKLIAGDISPGASASPCFPPTAAGRQSGASGR